MPAESADLTLRRRQSRRRAAPWWTTGPKYYITLAMYRRPDAVCFFFPWFYQLQLGIAAAGMNHPQVWGTYEAGFIFWIGLSHSGTLLSAFCTSRAAPGARRCIAAPRP